MDCSDWLEEDELTIEERHLISASLRIVAIMLEDRAHAIKKSGEAASTLQARVCRELAKRVEDASYTLIGTTE